MLAAHFPFFCQDALIDNNLVEECLVLLFSVILSLFLLSHLGYSLEKRFFSGKKSKVELKDSAKTVPFDIKRLLHLIFYFSKASVKTLLQKSLLSSVPAKYGFQFEKLSLYVFRRLCFAEKKFFGGE